MSAAFTLEAPCDLFRHGHEKRKRVELRGRQAEIDFLSRLATETATDENPVQTVLVHGPSGSGKTSICLELKSKFPNHHCLLGKFDQYSDRAAPCLALTQALDSLLESEPKDDQEREWLRQKVRDALGDEARVLINAVSSFAGLMSLDDNPSTHSKKSDSGDLNLASERLVVAVLSFFQSFCTVESPVILVVDDLQWADTDSWAVLAALAKSHEVSNLLVVGIYRDEEANKVNGFVSSIRVGAHVWDLAVSDLGYEETKEIIFDLLSIEKDSEQESNAERLARLVYTKVMGNPFFAIQFLAMLRSKGLLKYNFGSLNWEWDIDEITEVTDIADNVAEVLSHRVKQVDGRTRLVLQLAASLGYTFDTWLLGELCKRIEINSFSFLLSDSGLGGENGGDVSFEERLNRAVEERFLEHQGAMYRFAHDKVHQSVYELVSASGKSDQLHFEIGQTLLQVLEENTEKRPRYLFLAADQLNRGVSFMKSDDDRISLMKLNYEAIKLAQRRNGLELVGEFLEDTLQLVKESDWKLDYDLLMNTYSTAAEFEASQCRYDKGIEFADEVFRRATKRADTVQALCARGKIRLVQYQFGKSIQDLRSAMALCDERMPPANILMVARELRLARRAIHGRSDDYFLSLPHISDPKKTTALKILLTLAVCGWTVNPWLEALCGLRMFRITVQHGLSRYAGTAFAAFGAAVSAALNDTVTALRFAELALRLQGDGVVVPSTVVPAYCFSLHFKIPLASMLQAFLDGYRKGLEIGDSINGLTCLAFYADAYRCAGLRLDTFTSDLLKFAGQLKILRQNFLLGLLLPNLQFALYLTGQCIELSWNAIWKLGFFTADAKPDDSPPALLGMDYLQLFAAYIFQDVKVARQAWATVRSKPRRERRFVGSHFNNAFFNLVDGLVGFWLADHGGGGRRRRYWLRPAQQALEWFSRNPNLNTLPSMLLLQAIQLSVTRKDAEDVKVAFDKAIVACTRCGMVHYSAIANERAGEYFLQKNKNDERAAMYLHRALRQYQAWAATAKVQAMRQEHADLFGEEATRHDASAAFVTPSALRGRSQFQMDVDGATIGTSGRASSKRTTLLVGSEDGSN